MTEGVRNALREVCFCQAWHLAHYELHRVRNMSGTAWAPRGLPWASVVNGKTPSLGTLSLPFLGDIDVFGKKHPTLILIFRTETGEGLPLIRHPDTEYPSWSWASVSNSLWEYRISEVNGRHDHRGVEVIEHQPGTFGIASGRILGTLERKDYSWEVDGADGIGDISLVDERVEEPGLIDCWCLRFGCYSDLRGARKFLEVMFLERLPSGNNKFAWELGL